ncbi:Dam family site-specific DNA-(adenine-N6)-methyltransferase [Brenneria goodwinii]|uniref:Dam family site-specific DNA-(adenine-N6)-methyltransferase n=1 Tax=Brenneria goodwinii TaxID=1109412 RepID=UPI0036EF33F9
MSINGTPLKWAGSKARIMETLREHLPAGKRLVEPFAGSCAVMLNTDYDEYLIADINPDLINLYLCIKNLPESFLADARGMFDILNDEYSYYQSRLEFNFVIDIYRKSLLFFYLNRHCFNGVCRYNKRGEFNVPYGKYKTPYFPEKEIRLFAEKAQRATFLCCDFGETLDLVRPGDVVYCDSPYMPTSDTANFTQYHTDGFTKHDQYRLATKLASVARSGRPVIASNSRIAADAGLYAGFEIHHITAPRTISANGNRSRADEVIATMGQ